MQVLSQALQEERVKRLMVVADMAAYGERVKRLLATAAGKDITLFTAEPTAGRGFAQELLGYSVTCALGVDGSELP